MDRSPQQDTRKRITVAWSSVHSRGWYGPRIKVMEIPINQSGFVSSQSEGTLQNQAPAPPVGRVEQPAGAISVIALSNDKSRKRGLGLRASIPRIQHARGIKVPRRKLKFTIPSQPILTTIELILIFEDQSTFRHYPTLQPW